MQNNNQATTHMPSLVFMASGQGSQKPGMGVSLLSYAPVKESFECASDILGRDILSLVTRDDEEAAHELNKTKNAQAALVALSVGVGNCLLGQNIIPSALLGFSLGQISALAMSGMVSLEDAFRIVDVRSRLMDEAACTTKGAMSAFLKADEESVQCAIDQAAEHEVLCIANYNCPGQIVISGTESAVTRAEEAWASQGKRFSRLATQGAFHSPLMQSACEPFANFLGGITFNESCIPVICNTDAQPLQAHDAVDHLVSHLTHPVRFEQSVTYLSAQNARIFVETGFGGVLAGLVKRIDRTAKRYCVQDEASLMDVVEAFAAHNFEDSTSA